MFTIEVSGPGITSTKFSCDENHNWLICTDGESWRPIPSAYPLEWMYGYAQELCREEGPPRKWAEVQAAYEEGKTIQIKGKDWTEWRDWRHEAAPNFLSETAEYRVKPSKHKWAKEIKAWADGAEIEFRPRGANLWQRVSWYDTCDFRIKPKSNPLRYRVGRAYRQDGSPYLVCITEDSELLPSSNVDWATDWIEVPSS